MTIDFDLIVGSRSNFGTSFRMLFSLLLLSNHNTMTRRCGRPDLSNGLNWP